MNKKFVNTVIAVLLGMAVFVMIASTVSLIFEAILAHDIADITSVSEKMENFISYVRNSAIGIVVFSAAALVSYCFTYFTDKKRFSAAYQAV